MLSHSTRCPQVALVVVVLAGGACRTTGDEEAAPGDGAPAPGDTGDGLASDDAVLFSASGSATIEVVQAAPDGGVLVGGSFEGDLEVCSLGATSNGGADGFVLRVSEELECLWLTTVEGEGNEVVSAVAPLGDGRVVLAGEYDSPFVLAEQLLAHAG